MTVYYALRGGDFFVALPGSDVDELARTWAALPAARTFGELEAMLPQDAFESIMGYFEDEEVQPQPEDDFDYDALGFLHDYGWLRGPLERMRDWIPADLRRRYNEPGDESPMTGPSFSIAPENVLTFIEEVRSRGFTLVEDPDAIERAYGF
jgi:hypothetical protein